jgi:hypothetical protein
MDIFKHVIRQFNSFFPTNLKCMRHIHACARVYDMPCSETLKFTVGGIQREPLKMTHDA